MDSTARYDPPSLRMIVLAAALILVLVIADWTNNNLLFVADFVVIVIVAIMWFRFIRSRGFRQEYMPDGMASKDDLSQ